MARVDLNNVCLFFYQMMLKGGGAKYLKEERRGSGHGGPGQ